MPRSRSRAPRRGRPACGAGLQRGPGDQVIASRAGTRPSANALCAARPRKGGATLSLGPLLHRNGRGSATFLSAGLRYLGAMRKSPSVGGDDHETTRARRYRFVGRRGHPRRAGSAVRASPAGRLTGKLDAALVQVVALESGTVGCSEYRAGDVPAFAGDRRLGERDDRYPMI